MATRSAGVKKKTAAGRKPGRRSMAGASGKHTNVIFTDVDLANIETIRKAKGNEHLETVGMAVVIRLAIGMAAEQIRNRDVKANPSG